jgi:hypothetical protein
MAARRARALKGLMTGFPHRRRVVCPLSTGPAVAFGSMVVARCRREERGVDSRTRLGCKWWGLAIALAVDGGDVGSRARLAKATGDPEAWAAFAAIDMGKAGMAAGLAEFLAYVAEDPDHVDASRPCPGEPGYDHLVGRAAELSSRLIRGMLAGNPACLAPSFALSPQQSQEKCSPAVIVPRHRTTAGPPG